MNGTTAKQELRLLIVASSKFDGSRISPFVSEQIKFIQRESVNTDTYGITGSGILGYLRASKGLRQKIKEFRPDVIHAHYGLSGLSANLQRKVPVVTTYHGSDIHSLGWILALSRIAIKLSAYNIFVSKKLYEISGAAAPNSSIIPCGIDLSVIRSIPREYAKKQLGRSSPFVLFSGSFDKSIKNSPLAKAAMALLPGVELIELKGYSREEVNLLINAAECLLMTSYREGSPQVVKEAMACGTPIVSVDVGDVREVIGDTEGCYIAEYEAADIASKIKKAMEFHEKTAGRQRIEQLELDNTSIAKKIVSIYKKVVKR